MNEVHTANLEWVILWVVVLLIVCGIPLALYLLWLFKFSRRILFSGVLLLAVLAVTVLVQVITDSGFHVFQFFVGWVACVPIMIIEVVRTLLIWIRTGTMRTRKGGRETDAVLNLGGR